VVSTPELPRIFVCPRVPFKSRTLITTSILKYVNHNNSLVEIGIRCECEVLKVEVMTAAENSKILGDAQHHFGM